jgi:hypothetical protein
VIGEERQIGYFTRDVDDWRRIANTIAKVPKAGDVASDEIFLSRVAAPGSTTEVIQTPAHC